MTSSAERLAAQILGKTISEERQAPRIVTGAGHSTSAYGMALSVLAQDWGRQEEPIPGTRNTLPHDPFEAPFSRPGADQAQYRAGHVPSAQLRRPQQVQGTTPARGRNHWGAADQRQLGGVRPATGTET